MRENVLMCALFGELFAIERVSKYELVNTERQARELGVFSFVAGKLRLPPLLWWCWENLSVPSS